MYIYGLREMYTITDEPFAAKFKIQEITFQFFSFL